MITATTDREALGKAIDAQIGQLADTMDAAGKLAIALGEAGKPKLARDAANLMEDLLGIARNPRASWEAATE